MTLKLSHKQLLLLAAILVLSLILAVSNSLAPLTLHTPTTHNAPNLDSPFEPQGLSHDIYILDLSFSQCCLCIEKGDTITWTNNDPVIHTLWFAFAENKSTYLLSDPILPGQSWSHTFTEPHKFALLYYSFERLWITGTLRIYKILGDIDGDGDVDPDDFAAFAGAYGTSPPSNPWCDLDCDGDVDPDDFAIFAGNYGKTDP